VQPARSQSQIVYEKILLAISAMRIGLVFIYFYQCDGLRFNQQLSRQIDQAVRAAVRARRPDGRAQGDSAAAPAGNAVLRWPSGGRV
jgi:hypothetical protein